MRQVMQRFAVPLILVLLAAMAGQPACAEAQKVVSIEGITEYRLDNGLKILLFPDSSRPTVTVNMTILVGSRHEGYGETGMAHLLEHLLFKGTPTHPQIPKVLQERGAQFNGTTWVDRTNYYETLPATSENLEFAIRLEADRLVNSYVRRDDLLSEMTVVRNEFEQGENSPAQIMMQRMRAVAFEWHNYGKATIGNRSDIERVPIDNLQAFYRKYYQPDNTIVVVAGKFEEAEALEYIEKYFGVIPKPKRKLPQTYTEEPAQDGERSVTLRRVGDVGAVGIAYHVPSGGHPDIAALDVLSNILTEAPSGRLYKALVETKIASNVYGGAYSWHDPGIAQYLAMVPDKANLEKARDILIQVTEESGNQGATEEEVQRAIRQILKQRELAAADTKQIAVDLSEWAAMGDWRLYFLYRDWIEQITPDDVKRVAQTYLISTNRTTGMFVPTEEPKRVEIPQTPDLAKLLDGYKGREVVATGEDFDPLPENIQKRTTFSQLPTGIKTALLPKATRGNAVHLRLTLRYGNENDLKDFESAVELLPALMKRGTKNLNRLQIEDELDRLSAELNAGGELGAATFSIQTKRDKLPEVLKLLQQILREPTLPAEEFEILKQQTLASLEQQKTNPQSRAIRVVRRNVSPYPKGDVRYNPTVEEEIERVQALTVEKIQELYQFLGANVGELAIVGDFDPEACLPILSEALKDWKSSVEYARIPRLYFEDVKGTKEQINIPDKANAVYIAGIAFPMSDADPDYPAMLLGNFIFGGGSLSSRLGDRVRQQEGLSYGVGSFLSAEELDKRASVTIFAICNPENMQKVDQAILEELNRLLEKGVTEKELAEAKQGYLQQLKVARSEDDQLCALLANLLEADRSMQYYSDLEANIEKADLQAIHAAVKKYLDPQKLTIVHAGTFAK